MILDEILRHDAIAIQCHNIPDADALASGFALHSFLQAQGKKPIFFYGGPAITKPNLLVMIVQLGIPVQHLPQLDQWDGLLITVDCQHDTGNVSKVTAPHIVVIDHHIQEKDLPPLYDLRPWLGSCSTLIWDLLSQKNFPLDVHNSTALYYGLFMDTNSFSEVRHPLDKDMWDNLNFDERIFKQLRLSNLSLNDLLQTSSSLNNLNIIHEEYRLALIAAPMCDPNILGVISDLATQVDSIDTVVAHSPLPNGDFKFSVRTTTRDTKANDLASWIAHTMGSGGGHSEKAGGYIAQKKFEELHPQKAFTEYCEERICNYYESFRLIDCLDAHSLQGWPSTRTYRSYRKRPVSQGFVKTAAVFGHDVTLHVRTLEGDIFVQSNEDTYLMLGIDGEVYPIERNVFKNIYSVHTTDYTPNCNYYPTVLNTQTGMRISLEAYVQPCVSLASQKIQAYCLNDAEYVKIFTRWDQENYYSGGPGDWLLSRTENDLYIVRSDIFKKTYLRDFTDEKIEELPQAQMIFLKNHTDMAEHALWALQVQEDFCVERRTLSSESTQDTAQSFGQNQDCYLGLAGSWLVQNTQGLYTILSPNQWEKDYTLSSQQ